MISHRYTVIKTTEREDNTNKIIDSIYDKPLVVLPLSRDRWLSKLLAKKALEGKTSIVLTDNFWSTMYILNDIESMPTVANWVCERRSNWIRFITEAYIHCKSIHNMHSLLGLNCHSLILEMFGTTSDKNLIKWIDTGPRFRPKEQIILHTDLNIPEDSLKRLEGSIYDPTILQNSR